MKYLILESRAAYCVALGEDGRCVKCANMHYQPGDRVDNVIELKMPARERSPRRAARIISLCAAMAERFPDGRLVFDAAGPAAVKLMLKTWVKQAGIRDVGAYFSVRDAEKELTSWSNRISISSRGYMLGYQDLRGPGIRNIHRLLAGIADGPMKLQIVRMEFQARNGVSS